MHDKLHWKQHVSFEWAKSWSQICDSRKLFASRLKSAPYRIIIRFYAFKTTLYVAKHAQSKCETWSFVVRNMPRRGSRRHLSQLDTCLTAKTKFDFGASVAQNRRFRSLFHPKTSTNFLSKNHDNTHFLHFANVSWSRLTHKAIAYTNICLTHPSHI